jgi:hypothetical protein
MEYAWSWFSMHSAQRMQLANYFMLGATFLLAAYASLIQARNYAMAFAIALGGVALCVAFDRLDLRTRELVHIAENALRALEADLTVKTGLQVLNLATLAQHKRHRWSSYRTVLRLIATIFATLFIIGGIHAAMRWSAA